MLDWGREAAPWNGEGVELGVEVEVAFPVTFRFRQICFTNVPKAMDDLKSTSFGILFLFGFRW